jgi:hypothetical protein
MSVQLYSWDINFNCLHLNLVLSVLPTDWWEAASSQQENRKQKASDSWPLSVLCLQLLAAVISDGVTAPHTLMIMYGPGIGMDLTTRSYRDV